MDAVNVSPAFALHGKYVGPGWTGGRYTGHVPTSQVPFGFNKNRAKDFQVAPIDDLDAAARVHDYQYMTNPGNKAAADRILSKEAFRVARKEGISLKGAKALLVAAGMGAMSLVGSSDGSKLRHPPPVPAPKHPKPTFPPPAPKRPKPAPLVGVELNPGPKPQKQKGVMQPARQQPKQPPKQKKAKSSTRQSAPKQKAGTIIPAGLPIISNRSTAPKRRTVRNIKVKLDPVYAPGTIVAPGQVFFSFNLDRDAFRQTQLNKYFDGYRNWTYQRIRIEITPGMSTNTAGLAYVMTTSDPNELVPIGQIKPQSYWTGHGAIEHSVFGAKWGIDMPKCTRTLYTDVDRIVSSQISAQDERFDAAGSVMFAASDGFTTTNTDIASIYAIVTATFFNPSLSDDADVICCLKAQALGSGTTGQIAGAPAGTINLVSVFNEIIGSPLNTLYYSEFSVHPAFSANGFFNLPPGNYYVAIKPSFTSASTYTAANLGIETGSVFSWESNFDTDFGVGTVEFEANPGGLTSLSSSLWSGFAGMIRVDSGSFQNNFRWGPYYTFSTTWSLNALIVYVCKVPESISGRFASYFPFGNLGTAIAWNIVDGKKVVAERYVPRPISSQHQLVTKKDWEEFKQYQISKTNPVVLDFDEKGTSYTCAPTSVDGMDRNDSPVAVDPLAKSIHLHLPTTSTSASYFSSVAAALLKPK